LLSGCKPFCISGQRLSELERLICEEDAPAPSSAVRQASVESPDLARKLAAERGLTSQRLAQQLSGDLDIIIAPAMRKEPQRRYASAQQLASDIARHLNDQPVMARADSWHYIFGKFIRRHVAAVAASAAFILMLTGFAITTTLQAGRIEQERDLAQLEREGA